MNLSTETIVKLLQVRGIGRGKVFALANLIPPSITDDATIADIILENVSQLRLSSLTREEIEKAFSKGHELYDLSLEKNIKLVGYKDTLYPQALREITAPPVLLSVLGNVQALTEMPALAVIGTRHPSMHGKQIAERLGFRLGESEINVVSGLAIGCDTAAHIGCLCAKGVTTAVLAHGLDMIYPKENSGLAQTILDSNGCLVSEYLIKTKSLANYFVERDRIQAGLSKGTIIAETDIKGGTMITARNTLEYKRILAAYYHPIDKRNEKSRGNEMLISKGDALKIESPDDIDNLIRTVNPDFFQRAETNKANEIDRIQMPFFDLEALTIKDYKLKEKKKKAPRKKKGKSDVIQQNLYNEEDRTDIRPRSDID